MHYTLCLYMQPPILPPQTAQVKEHHLYPVSLVQLDGIKPLIKLVAAKETWSSNNFSVADCYSLRLLLSYVQVINVFISHRLALFIAHLLTKCPQLPSRSSFRKGSSEKRRETQTLFGLGQVNSREYGTPQESLQGLQSLSFSGMCGVPCFLRAVFRLFEVWRSMFWMCRSAFWFYILVPFGSLFGSLFGYICSSK